MTEDTAENKVAASIRSIANYERDFKGNETIAAVIEAAANEIDRLESNRTK